MQPFRNFGESDDPWFRVGQFAVTTTAIVSAMSVAYMFVWAFEGFSRPITTKLLLNPGTSLGSVGDGQIWRLVTWPIPTEPSLGTLLLVAVFWMLGSQLEALMGRKRFTFFLLVLTIVPALVMTALELTDTFGVVYGLRVYGLLYVELGVLIAFATHYSSVRFWPGIPSWILAGVVVGMAMLQAISNQRRYELVLTVTMALLAPLMLRALGHAEQHEWLPKFPLPARSAGGPQRRPPRRQRGGPQRGAPQHRRPQPRSSHLSSVPPPPPPPAAEVEAQAKIDALLDKMGEHGLESLTEAERRTLEDLSKRLRDRRDRS